MEVAGKKDQAVFSSLASAHSHRAIRRRVLSRFFAGLCRYLAIREEGEEEEVSPLSSLVSIL